MLRVIINKELYRKIDRDDLTKAAVQRLLCWTTHGATTNGGSRFVAS